MTKGGYNNPKSIGTQWYIFKLYKANIGRTQRRNRQIQGP